MTLLLPKPESRSCCLWLGVSGCRVQTSLPALSPPLLAPGDTRARALCPRSLPLAAAAAAATEMLPSGLELMNGRVLPAFLLCSALLVIKMYVMAVITGQVRLRKKVGAALGDPQSRVRALTSPAAAGKAGVGDLAPGVCGSGLGETFPSQPCGMAPLWPARPGPLVVLFSSEFARSPCAGAVLTSVALPSQYWRRLSEHWPGVLRAFYPLAVSQVSSRYSQIPESHLSLQWGSASL